MNKALALPSTLQPDTAQQAAWPHLQQLAEALERPAQRVVHKGVEVWQIPQGAPVGVYLFGPVGRGKSMLMQQLFDAAPLTEKRRVHFHGFMEDLHQRLHHHQSVPGVDMMWQVASDISAQARLLCFDEFYVTNIADAMLLGRLLEALFACGMTLCATSNWPIDDLYQDGHNRQHFMPFMKVLKRHLQPLDLGEGADWRQQTAARPGKNGLSTPQAAFKALSGRAPKPATVTLGHTALSAKGRVRGYYWFTFTELCTRPLARSEYMALVDGSKGLVISDMPALDATQTDEALRFVVLVDLLYEAGCPLRLFTIDGTALEDLCPAGPAAFAFARALSRLTTLQGLG